MNCPNCGNPLNPGARFCRNCGVAVPQPAPQEQQDAPPSPYPPTVQQPQPTQVQQPQPAQLTPAQQPVYTPAHDSSEVGQLGASGISSSLWSPFAGYGTRREHVAWLLEGLGTQAEDLRNRITGRFSQRQIPQAEVTPVTLTSRGVAVEQRPFYRIQRGLATVWLYIARYGEDLYVSQVSYVKGKISLARILMVLGLCGMVLLAVLNGALVSINLQQVADSIGGGFFGSGPSVEPNMFLISTMCCTGPLSLIAQVILIIGLIFSAYKFLTEKDFLALLRARPNEFQEDDIVSLEKSVNETVRQAADLVGIDRKLLAPERAYRAGRRLI